MPRLSVLMPVRNGERFLRRAVSSVLRSMPKDSELAICDDGSSDRTPNILAELAVDRRVRVLRTAGVGVSAALNKLIAATESEFVARMDADDVCLPWRFSLQLGALETADVVFSSVIFTSEDGWPQRPDRPGRITPEAVPLHLLMGNVLVHPTMTARRAALNAGQFYRATSAEDFDLWLRLAGSGYRLLRLATPALLYRRHPAQVSKSGAWLNAASDPMLDESYAALLLSELGDGFGDPRGLRRAVASGESAALGSDAALFDARMRERARRLGPLQRALLMSRLAASFDGKPAA